MMLVTIVEDGDIIVVDKEGSVLTQDSHYYIKKDGALVEVEWYEASRYQAEHKKQRNG
jgi:regulator of RNase E activity RraA